MGLRRSARQINNDTGRRQPIIYIFEGSGDETFSGIDLDRIKTVARDWKAHLFLAWMNAMNDSYRVECYYPTWAPDDFYKEPFAPSFDWRDLNRGCSLDPFVRDLQIKVSELTKLNKRMIYVHAKLDLLMEHVGLDISQEPITKKTEVAKIQLIE